MSGLSLVHYDHNKKIHVATDACNMGLDAVLLNKEG